MVELIALIILVCSLGGIALILAKKIPVLVQLSGVQEGIQKEKIISILKKRIKNISFDKIIFLRTLSKTRIYILKVEKYIDNRLQGMRKKIVKKQEEAKAEEKKEESRCQNHRESPDEIKDTRLCRDSTESGQKKEENKNSNPPASGPPTTPE